MHLVEWRNPGWRHGKILLAEDSVIRTNQASAEHLQLAPSALGLVDGFTTAKPMATAIAIFNKVNIFDCFFVIPRMLVFQSGISVTDGS